MKKGFYKKGFSLIEVIVASSIIAVSVISILAVYTTFLRNTFDNTASLQASYLAEEGIEAAKSMRDFGWNQNINPLTVGTNYYPYFNTGANKWQATSSSSTIDATFTRTFKVDNAYRDASDNLVTSGTLDSNSRLLTVNVTWVQGTSTKTKTLQTYLTNLYNN